MKNTVAIEPAITISNQAARKARGPLTVCGKPCIDELRKKAFHNLCRAFPGSRWSRHVDEQKDDARTRRAGGRAGGRGRAGEQVVGVGE